MMRFTKINEDDRQGTLHDAPGDMINFVLWGAYLEHRFEYKPVEGLPLPPVVTRRRGFLSFVRYMAKDAVRVELVKRADGSLGSAYMFSWMGKPYRNAGFWGQRQGRLGHQQFGTSHKNPDGTTIPVTVQTSHVAMLAHWVPTYFYKAEAQNAKA